MNILEKYRVLQERKTNSGEQRIFKVSCHSENIKMKYLYIFILLAFVSTFSCTKNLCACDPGSDGFFMATVMETSNLDCGRPSITIDGADAAAVRQLTGATMDTYVVDRLPANLNVASKKLYVHIGTLTPSEDFMCTTLGITYPHLKVVHAIERN
jgi:hypothetical protein